MTTGYSKERVDNLIRCADVVVKLDPQDGYDYDGDGRFDPHQTRALCTALLNLQYAIEDLMKEDG